MSIVKVPLYKQLTITSKNIAPLNESNNTHKRKYKDLINEADDYARNTLGCKDYIVEFDNMNYKPYLIINEDLDVSNLHIRQFKFPIDTVKGNVNVEHNMFRKFSDLPKNIYGDLKIGDNYISNFNGGQNMKITGNIFGGMKQNVPLKYKLNKDLFKIYKMGCLNENSVKILSKNQYGQIVDILNENICVVKVNFTNKIIKCKTSDVDCIYNIKSELND